MTQTAFFTGHRPKDLFPNDADRHKRYTPAAYSDLAHALAGVVSTLAQHGITEFRTGGAQGVDQVAFLAVENVKNNSNPHIKNDLVLYDNMTQPWKSGKPGSLFSKEDLQRKIERADSVYFTTERDRQIHTQRHPEQVGIAYTDPSRDGLPNLRNRQMAIGASVCIAVRKPETGDYHVSRGGTAHAMRIAESEGCAIIAIDPGDMTADTIRIYRDDTGLIAPQLQGKPGPYGPWSASRPAVQRDPLQQAYSASQPVQTTPPAPAEPAPAPVHERQAKQDMIAENNADVIQQAAQMQYAAQSSIPQGWETDIPQGYAEASFPDVEWNEDPEVPW